jgi:hypothetical protein
VLAWLALLSPPSGLAQDRGGSPETLWKEYPLAPTAAPSPQQTATSSPAPRSTVAAGTDGDGSIVVLVLIALFTVGGTITFLGVRRRRGSEAPAAAAPPASAPVEDVSAIPALWHGRSGRFARRTSDARAAATVASAPVGGRPSPAGGDPPEPPIAAAAPAGRPSPVTPPAAGRRAGSPPDDRLAWTAEIEWRDSDGESRFCVVARGAGTVVLAQSAPLQWPPSGPAAVQAMTEAAEQLAAMLADAGWKELAPGASWYSKRFAWEPVAVEKPVAASQATPPPTPAKGGARDRRRRNFPRWQTIVLFCLLVALAPIAVYALSSDVDNAPVRSAPTPVATATEAPTVQPSPAPSPSDGVDLTVPLIVLLGLVALILLMIRTQRARR